MGIDLGVGLYLPYICNDLLHEIKNLTKEKENLKIQGITAKLVDFLMSDKYIYLHIEDYKEKKPDDYVILNLFSICEYFEKFLSIKLLFPLIEELKKSKFENQINKVILLSKNEKERNNFKNNYKVPNLELDKDWNNILKGENNKKYFEFLAWITTFLIDWFILGKQKFTKIQLIEGFFKDLKKNSDSIRKLFKKDELKNLLNGLLALNYPLKYTKEINNLFIAALNFIIFSYDKSGTLYEEHSIIIYYLFPLYPAYLEIKSVTKNKKILNLKAIITKLAEFYTSDIFFLLEMRGKLDLEFSLGLVIPIFIICENIENYLSIKCLFPLIEELKKSKFEEQINKIIQLSKNEKEKDNFIINYYKQYQKEEDFTIEFKNYMENCNLILKQKKNLTSLCIIFGMFSTFFKYEDCPDIPLDKENLINIFFSEIDEFHKKLGKEFKDNKELLNYLMKLDYPLENTNEIYQLFICAANIFLSFEKLKDKFDENIVKELKKILCEKNISENKICIIYEKKNINDKSQSKYNISYYAKKKVRDNKMSLNFFEKIAKNNNKYAYKNLFNDKEISEDEFNKFKNDNIDDNKKIKDDKVLNSDKIINNKQKAIEPEIKNEIKENKNAEILKELTEEKNKNKKLISIIFTNSTQEFHYSIICKNTDIFSTLEAKLYEKFPQYGETDNYFIANGNKVIGHKTLEDNNIKDSDIVILHKFGA